MHPDIHHSLLLPLLLLLQGQLIDFITVFLHSVSVQDSPLCFSSIWSLLDEGDFQVLF